MQEKRLQAEVGVIIGRFQCHTLHQGHKDLIKEVFSRHHKLIIILGLSRLRNTVNNPLDFKARQKMILEEFPDVEVLYVEDSASDEVWSKNVDKVIKNNINPGSKVVIYGSRDSFIPHYTGIYTTCELDSSVNYSATQLRSEVANKYKISADYRAGMIAAAASRFPVCYQTVDVAVLDGNGNLLLVRKPDESKWRFPGGFSDASSNSLEEDAKREVYEETKAELSEVKYLGSMLIDDWRYRGERDKIKTAFFVGYYQFGRVEASDDVAQAKWIPIKDLDPANIVAEHHPLMEILLKHLNEN